MFGLLMMTFASFMSKGHYLLQALKPSPKLYSLVERVDICDFCDAQKLNFGNSC
jgi:hypothetical protein